jgi:poly(hydroxyalkanoate) depolymerase family esterase
MAGSLPSALARLYARVRTWLVRLGLLRGRWRRGRTTLEITRLVPGLRTHRTWHYGLYIPAGLRDDERAPLIVVLHGCRQRALRFGEASGWVAHAEQTRVRLLCPDQRRWSNLFRCWNWFDPSAQRGLGEVQLVASMIDEVAQSVNVDAQSIAAVGVSAGGALAALLAFHHPDRFRAVATVSAPPLLIGNFSLQSPKLVMQHGLLRDPALALGGATTACTPMLIIHGREDTVVNPRCAEQLMAQAAESYRRAGIQTERLERNGTSGLGDVTEYHAGDALVLRRIEIPGLGHVWTGGPGGHPYCERGGPDLTAMCAQFLRDVGFGAASPELPETIL